MIRNRIINTIKNPYDTGNISDLPINVDNELVNNSIMNQSLQGQGSDMFTDILDLTSGILAGAGQSYAVKGLSGLIGVDKKAYGGELENRNVEIEGNEAIELPNDDVLLSKGNTHEEGGIDVELPTGTKIFSNRIKIDDETLSDRKIKRTRRELTLNQFLNKYRYDNLLSNTVRRTVENNKKIDEYEMDIQNTINAIKENSNKFATGGIINDDDKKTNVIHEDDIANNIELNPTVVTAKRKQNVLFPNLKPNIKVSIGKFSSPFSIPKKNVDTDNAKNNMSFLNNLGKEVLHALGNVSIGDIIAGYGTYSGANRLKDLVYEQRASDTPNKNPYENYGKDSLEELEWQKDMYNKLYQSKLANLERDYQANKNNIHNNVRGINQLNALNLASDLNKERMINQMADEYISQMINLNNSKVNLLNNIDRVRSSGEAQRMLADLQDKDNFYTNLGQAESDKSKMIQYLGQIINNTLSNITASKLASNMSNYGIGIDIFGNKYKND